MNNDARNEYADLASKYDRRWAFYVQATTQKTLQYLDLQPTDKLLDIGCGTGALLETISHKYPQVSLTGLDVSSEMLDIARQKVNAELHEASAESLPFVDNSFSIITSCSSLHYWRNPVKSFDEIARVLKPNGKIVITDWCRDSLIGKLYDKFIGLTNKAHFKTYSSKELEAMLAEAGFVDIIVEKYKINWFWEMMTVQAKLSL